MSFRQVYVKYDQFHTIGYVARNHYMCSDDANIILHTFCVAAVTAT